MVNFNNETTVSTPAIDIVRVLALQSRANVFEALEKYKKEMAQCGNSDSSILISRLVTWFLEHQAYLERTRKNENELAIYNDIKKSLLEKEELTEKEILQIILYLNNVVDNLKLTKLDTRKQWDRSNWEEDNKNQGFM